MKVFNFSMMLTVQLNYVLLILSLFATVCSFPSTPLNRKNQEISWEAWLLVDDQNQNQNRQSQGEQMPKHRITAKSVFVAPTFSPQDLPPCAEGYNSDSMGRCIKIIKLREDNQLSFLLSKLNAQFGPNLDYDTIPEEPNSAPTRVDIPLIMDFGDDYGSEFEEEHDMAIIVTQTTKASDKNEEDDNSNFDKRDQKLNVDVLEEELKKLTKVTTSATEKYQVKTETLLSTTGAEELSTTPYTTADKSTTMEDNVDSTISPTTIITRNEETTTFDADDSYTQTEFSDTTEEFRTTTTTNSEVTSVLPTTTDEIETTTLPSNRVTPTTPKVTTYHPVATTYHPYFDLGQMGNTRTKNFVKFPSEEVVIPRSHPNGNYVRFPDFDSKYQQESLNHHTRDVDDQTGNFFNEVVTPEPSEQVHEILLPPKRQYNFDARRLDGALPEDVQHHSNPHRKAHVPPENEEQYQFPFGTTEQFPNKRSREKYGNVSPPKWPPEDIHKPIVLRFSRKHFHFNNNKFKNSEFYRSLPTDDLTYLFGHKNGHTSHR